MYKSPARGTIRLPTTPTALSANVNEHGVIFRCTHREDRELIEVNTVQLQVEEC